MKVYAEFIKDKQGKEYRRKTLLVFGTSHRLIGSAVLINPGSAKNLTSADEKFLKKFYAENHAEQNIDFSHWKEYNPDSTMRQLEKIFNGSYIGKYQELNGVIQLFNCFYDRNQNLKEAIKNFDPKTSYVFDEAIYFKNKPVYFGWGNAGKGAKLRGISEKIFTEYISKEQTFYDHNYEDNKFYHPGYINRSYKMNQTTKSILNKFFNTLQNE